MRSDCRGEIRTSDLLPLTSDLSLRGLLLWRSCHNQVVRLANKGFEFVGGQDVRAFQKNPFVAADIRCGGDAFDFEEFVELLWRGFKSYRGEFALGEINDGEYLAAHLEAEVFAPLQLLGRVAEGKAEFANP